jgi:hypothetical protein
VFLGRIPTLAIELERTSRFELVLRGGINEVLMRGRVRVRVAKGARALVVPEVKSFGGQNCFALAGVPFAILRDAPVNVPKR